MKITEAKVKEMVKLCIRHLRKKKYELNLPKSVMNDAIKHLSIYQRNGGTSSAGLCSIKINILNWQMGNKAWNEYDAFNKDPVIGRIEVNDNEDITLCLVAHEVSHYIQYTYRGYLPEYLEKDYRKPHGRTFQKIYRYLRADLVNPMIESKKMENAA
jgi:hypothetical protein